MAGYDSALRSRKDDDLGRWRFAAEIADVIRLTPPDWSARIGIFGKWGEGKSTVLQFIEEMLKPEGNVVFSFTPWAVQELDELWQEFGNALIDALKTEKLDVESPWKDATRKLQGKIESTGLSELAQGTAEFFGKDKAYKSVLGLMGKWLKPDGEQVKKIREKLKDKRVVVFIDDLDRATPELLPKLLLSLREILDLPGFTFVLAFDNEIVSDGLITSNKAWGDGDNFLDKILDFQFYLPPVTKAAKHTLLMNMLIRYADFVPRDSVDAVEHLLPDNPRKLKQLVRGLLSLKKQATRHGNDELSWVEVWIAEMIRQESHAFFMRLLDGSTLETLIGVGYKVRESGRRNRGQMEEGPPDTDIRTIVSDLGGINEKQIPRLIELVKAARQLSGYNLAYNFKFALRPEAITWKEFYELEAQWKKVPKSTTLSTWISGQETANSIDTADIETELFDTLLNAKHTAESKAAESAAEQDNARHCVEANALLTMTEQFLELPDAFTPDRFGKLYGKSLYWIAFRVNQADRDLREAEKNLLYSLCDRATADNAPAMLETLKPWDEWTFTPEDSNVRTLKIELRDECVKRLQPKIDDALASYVKRPESVRLLSTSQGSNAFRYTIFSLDRIPWSPVVSDALFGMFLNAKEDEVAFEKASDFLHLLESAANERSNSIARGNAEKLIGNRGFVVALWQAATSRRIQFRMLQHYLHMRGALLKLGAKEEDLPLTDELAAAKGTTTTLPTEVDVDIGSDAADEFLGDEDGEITFE
jgi:hypothetical protein